MVKGASLTTYAWTGYGALESEITGNSTTGYSYNGQDQLAVVTDPTGDKTTYSFDGDGLRRSVGTTDISQDPPTLDITTMVWDGSDYLLLNEPTGNRVVLTLDSEIVGCGSKDLLTDPLGSLSSSEPGRPGAVDPLRGAESYRLAHSLAKARGDSKTGT